MKSKLPFLAFLCIVAYACSPKLQVTAMQPDPVQVPPKLASVEEEKPIADAHAEGKSLYENKCNMCHGLYKSTDFTKEQWGPIMASMQIKAGTDNAQTAKIYNYITADLK